MFHRCFLLLLVATGTTGCASTQMSAAPLSADAQTTHMKAVGTVLDAWHAAAARADEEAYFSRMTEDSVFLGTDATERWDKQAFREYAHPHFAKGKAWTFTPHHRHVRLSSDGMLGWFDEALDTANLGPARGSGVVRRGKDGAWRIVHYNLTLTIPNEHVKAVRELLRSP